VTPRSQVKASRVVSAVRSRLELFLELISAGVGIGFAPEGLKYPVLTAPDSALRLIAVDGVRLERHLYLILPSPGETSPAAGGSPTSCCASTTRRELTARTRRSLSTGTARGCRCARRHDLLGR